MIGRGALEPDWSRSHVGIQAAAERIPAMDNDSIGEWVTRQDAAEVAGREVSAIKRDIAKYSLPTQTGAGGAVMVRIADLIDNGWISADALTGTDTGTTAAELLRAQILPPCRTRSSSSCRTSSARCWPATAGGIISQSCICHLGDAPRARGRPCPASNLRRTLSMLVRMLVEAAALDLAISSVEARRQANMAIAGLTEPEFQLHSVPAVLLGLV